MKLKIGIAIDFFILLSLVLVPGYSFAQLEEPVYHVGDYWTYKVTGDMSSGLIPISLQGIGMVKVEDQTTLTIEGSIYDVWKVTQNIAVTSDTFNLSMVMYSTLYPKVSDLARVKEFNDNEITSTVMTESSHEEITYLNPQAGLDYPVNVGDSWERHVEKEITDDTGTRTETEDIYYECTGTTEVNTEAGSFTCYIIRRVKDDPQGDTYDIEYRSQTAGYTVKALSYEEGNQTLAMTLTAYNYLGDDGDNGGGTPGFEMVLVVIALISMVIFIKKKR